MKEILIEMIEFCLDNDDKLILDDRMRDDIKDIQKLKMHTYNISHNGIIVFGEYRRRKLRNMEAIKNFMDGE